jgi:hypothetical protein
VAGSAATTASAASPHTREVRGPSARAETWAVARALFHVAYWAALLVSAETSASRASPGAVPAAASAFERRFQDLAPADQRIFRSVQEGVLEAERVRSSTGRWPSAEALARAGVPPFAPDPIDRARYAWQSVQTGQKADYIGVPTAGSGRESFFVVIVEPDPGTPNDPLAREDEIHHRLADGSMIHVTVWMGPPLPDTSEAFAVLPVEQGYRQVVATAPPPGG